MALEGTWPVLGVVEPLAGGTLPADPSGVLVMVRRGTALCEGRGMGRRLR